jgi:hypothetical protein
MSPADAACLAWLFGHMSFMVEFVGYVSFMQEECTVSVEAVGMVFFCSSL